MHVKLSDVLFHSHHGVMEQERRLGNEFSVDVDVAYTPSEWMADADDIEDTVSYADLYALVKEEMTTPRRLLETVAVRIARRIKERWNFVESVSVDITKLTPPIAGMDGKATVRFNCRY